MAVHSAIRRASLFLGISFFGFALRLSASANESAVSAAAQAIVDIVEALPTPGVECRRLARGKRWMLIEHFAGLPTVADLAQPELRLAGLRFNPKTDGPPRGVIALLWKCRRCRAGKLSPFPVCRNTQRSDFRIGLPTDAKFRL